MGKLEKQIENNKRKILRVLEKKAPLSISEISKLTKIPQSTVWFYVNRYLKGKIVRKKVKVTKHLYITYYLKRGGDVK